MQWCWWGSNLRPLGFESSTLPLATALPTCFGYSKDGILGWWPWNKVKVTNQINSLLCQNNISSLSIIHHSVHEITWECYFDQNLTVQSAVVTLKLRWRSPKSNQLFPHLASRPNNVSLIYASLVKIYPLVQKIECLKEATLTGSSPKTKFPATPWRGGGT